MTESPRNPDPATARKWRDLLRAEQEAAALYDRIAAAETGERAEILRELAAVERRHAGHWEARLTEAGLKVPTPRGPGLRTRLLGATARFGSVATVLRVVERAERSDAGVYDHDPDAAPGMAADERGHAKTIAALLGGEDSVPGRISRREGWHRGDRSGARAGGRLRDQRRAGVQHRAGDGVRRLGGAPACGAAGRSGRAARRGVLDGRGQSTCRCPGSGRCSSGRSPWRRSSWTRSR